MRRLALALVLAAFASLAAGAETRTSSPNPVIQKEADSARVAKKTKKPAKKATKSASQKKTKKAATSKK